MKKFLLGITISLMLITWNSLNAQTGKPRYNVRVERADTTLGFIKFELFPIIAPLHTAYFDSLVSIQFYDSTAIHRVVPDFVIQGGDPNSRHGPRDTWGMGDSTQQNIPAEFTGAAHKRGTIGAARDEDINSANSQWFVNVADNLFLNHNYTVYGKVVEGMDLVDFIVNVPRDANDNPLEKISTFITRADTNFSVPDNPVLLSPVNGLEGSTGFQKIEWNEVADAVLYDVEVAEDSNFTNLFFKDSVGSNSFTISDLELGQKMYYWRIRTNNGGFKSGFSETRNFVTSIRKPIQVSPPDKAEDVSLSPVLTWSKVTGASYYKVLLAKSATFSRSQIVYDSTGVVDTAITVTGLEMNTKYYWKIQGFTDTYAGPKSKVWNFSTQLVNSVSNESLPKEYALYQNFPNPFNPSTTIKYALPQAQSGGKSLYSVKMIVYDLLGRKVAELVNEEKPPGFYEVTFDAGNLSSGIYFYRLTILAESSGYSNKLTSGDFSSVKKLLLMK
jgi:cyclophilin family peptidyl-prolyl cis-trans isomerase